MLIMEYLSEGDLHNHLMNYRYVYRVQVHYYKAGTPCIQLQPIVSVQVNVDPSHFVPLDRLQHIKHCH